MPSGWDDYIPHIENFFSKKASEFTKKNVCSGAAIIGLDGTVWAQSKTWPGLKEYDYALE